MNYTTIKNYDSLSLVDICLKIYLHKPKKMIKDKFKETVPKELIKRLENAKVCRCGKYYFEAKYLIISNGTKYPIKDSTAYEDRDFEMRHKIHCFDYDVNKYIRIARQMDWIGKHPNKVRHIFIDC